MRNITTVIPAYKRDLGNVINLLETLKKNGSTDTILVLNGDINGYFGQLKSKYPNVKILYNRKRVSPAVARNLGARYAKKEFILFIDADCTPDKNYFRILKRKNLNDADAIVGALRPKSVRSDLQKSEWIEHENAFKKYTYSAGGRLFAKTIAGANFLIRRDLLDESGGFDESLVSAEDRELGARLYSRGIRIEYCPQLLVYHKFNPSFKSVFFRHLWHARGNSRVYRMYPEIFKNAVMNRLSFLKTLTNHVIDRQISATCLAYYVLLTISYTLVFWSNSIRTKL